MSQAQRQQNLYGQVDWTSIYQTFSNADFASYDYETLRKSMMDYIRLYHPENYNDYIQSSEFVALIDLISFMGQSLSYRFDLNARENFIQTAQSRNAITNIASTINYQASRNVPASGFLKIKNISINDDVFDSLGNNLNGLTITWNDRSNTNWLDQWNSIINAIVLSSQSVNQPGNSNLINGISVLEYSIELPSGVTSPFSFNALINNTSMPFESINASSLNETYLYELPPNNSTIFNLLYKNDGLGYSSNNTGYFLDFKQGTLQNESFTISESLPNRTVPLTTTGINNTDVWLFQINSDGSLTEWTQVDAVYGENAIYNSTPNSIKSIFSIISGSQDTITLVFGDGVFSEIPVGNFICYMRVSNGLSYRINPSEMSSVQLSIPYLSKLNRSQTFSVNASLLYTVANSSTTESLSDIKLRAPQSYYSQNRMVNGQDYNSFPFTKFNNIIKIKAVNRSSSGISRYLDVIDPTGQYSSTNIFCDDGFIYSDNSIQTNLYNYVTRDDIANLVENNVLPMISSSNILSFFYENYSTFSPINTAWNLILTDNTTCSGFISDSLAGTLITVNDSRFSNIGVNSTFIEGALLKFIPPVGYVFDNNNDLTFSSGSILIGQQTELYAEVTNITLSGLGNQVSANGQNADGSGAIKLSQKIPSNSILSEILPVYTSTLTANVVQTMIDDLIQGNAISLQYNPSNINVSTAQTWVTDNTLPLNFSPGSYSTSFQSPGSANSVSTNSWLLALVPGASNNANAITVYQRSINYYFGSANETTFFFNPNSQVYDPASGEVITDTITVLKTNSLPGSSTNTGFSQDIPININGIVNAINGFIDVSRVSVTSANQYQTNTPVNPYFFDSIVGSPMVSSYIFFVTDNVQETTTILPIGSVKIVSSSSGIDNNLYSYANGDIVFVTSSNSFFQISRQGTVASKNTLNNSGDQLTYTYFIGRQNLQFQYEHIASSATRIDPTPSNIIDIYILEQSYATDFQAWITDTTGQLSEPTLPTTESLRNDFISLEQYKMVSDQIIYNPVSFKILFGNKADASLQAQFVVVKNPNIIVGDGEIKSQMITAINNYFAITNWDFGETFYFTELSTYLHNELGNLIVSVQLVPTASNLQFGNLQEILCSPYEIFTSGATVDNITVVSNLNNINLRIS